MVGERLSEVLRTYRKRYRAKNRKERSKVLDEFCGLTNYHRKYAIALLGRPEDEKDSKTRRRRGPTYSPKALRVLERIWQAADYP